MDDPKDIAHLSRVRLDCFNQIRAMTTMEGSIDGDKLESMIKKSRTLEAYVTEGLDLQKMGKNLP